MEMWCIVGLELGCGAGQGRCPNLQRSPPLKSSLGNAIKNAFGLSKSHAFGIHQEFQKWQEWEKSKVAP